jgi:predicted site-specific integrase-resolvase
MTLKIVKPKPTDVDELFDDIIERNTEVKERLAKERKLANEKLKQKLGLKK